MKHLKHILFALALTLLAGRVHAATNVVLNANNSGAGSLRQTILDSVSGDTICFTNILSGATILLTSGQITLDKSLTIDASTLASGITLNGNNASRIFTVNSGTTNVLTALTLTNGNSGKNNSGGGIYNFGTLTVNQSALSGNTANNNSGGGIYNDSGTLTVNQSMLSGNTASSGGGIYNKSGTLMVNQGMVFGNAANFGGGIYNFGTLTVNQSTLSGNTANNSGGGFYSNGGTLTVNQSTLFGNNTGNNGGGIFDDHGTLTVNQSTLSRNTAHFVGGGIYQYYGALNLNRSIVAGNSGGSGSDNIEGNIASGVNNLTSGNPLLAALGNYGGPTPTMPPLPGSPAIDGCTGGTNFTTDQRGFPRIAGPFADIGAVEGVFNPNFPLINPVRLGNGTFRFSFTNLTGASYTIFASTNVALPITQWSNLGAPMESPAGTFQITDPQATNKAQRFYRVTSP
jgi:hypothetical protein